MLERYAFLDNHLVYVNGQRRRAHVFLEELSYGDGETLVDPATGAEFPFDLDYTSEEADRWRAYATEHLKWVDNPDLP